MLQNMQRQLDEMQLILNFGAFHHQRKKIPSLQVTYQQYV